MAKIIVRDGKEYFFKDDASEEEINSFFDFLGFCSMCQGFFK